MLFIAVLVTIIIGLPGGEFEDPFTDCDFFYNVALGQSYEVSTPGFHNGSTYPPGTNCRWTAECPVDHQCQLVCNDISLPNSISCSMDRLLIIPYNDSKLDRGSSFCGKGTFTTKSSDRVMKIALVTSSESPGGKFFCQLTAVPKSHGSCNCGYKKRLHPRVVDGEEAEPNEFPMMAALTYINYNFVICGATIIHPRFFLTAAHCIMDLFIDILAVMVGKHDLTEDDDFSQLYGIVAIAPHPKFDTHSGDFDAAILRTGRKMLFTDQIGPACLPFKYKHVNITGLKFTTIGWGDLSWGGNSTDVLMKVELEVVSKKFCRQTYPSLKNSQFCMYTHNKDSCEGDSGGPVLYTDPSTGALFNMGIVSFGKNCSTLDTPSINAKVAKLLGWIVFSLKDYAEEYCRM